MERSDRDLGPEYPQDRTYTGEGTIVPEVAFVREAVADEAKLALLDVLLDRVKEFFFRDLEPSSSQLYSSLRQPKTTGSAIGTS